MILSVERTSRGPEIIVTRAHPDLLRRLFEMEVPEIYNGIVEIRGIAREAGSRSKVAVFAKQEGVDPVGACVGLRGIRIQNIVNELQGEKIDVIQWSKDDSVFIAHALSPAQPTRVELNEAEMEATVIVPDRSLSLAIGREGQNARLAAKLTGWKVDIKSSTEIEIERMKRQIDGDVAERAAAEEAVGEVATSETVKAQAEPVVASEAVEPAVAEAPAVQAADEEVAVMAELQEEAAAAEQAAAAAAGPALSAEEMLALESLDLEPLDEQEEIVVEEVVTEEVSINNATDVWAVPKAAGGVPQIRFAEDILGAQTARRPGGRRRSSRPNRNNRTGPRPQPNVPGGGGNDGGSSGGG
jgi:N utilization substance protein A